MPQFILLLRGDRAAVNGFSPEELQKLMHKYQDWRRTKATGGQKLMDGEGRVLQKQNGKPSSLMVHSPRRRKWWADSSSSKPPTMTRP